MKLCTKNILYRFRFVIGCTLFTLLLSACGAGSVGNSTASATSTSAPLPAPSPAAIPSPNFTAYAGNGFTVQYPETWTVKKTAAGADFTDKGDSASFIVTIIPNFDAAYTINAAIQDNLNSYKRIGKNFQRVGGGTTTTISGDTWSQSVVTEDITAGGKTFNEKFVTLFDNHPAKKPSTKMYQVGWAAPTQLADGLDQTTFQPMLQSFKFA